ncbi:MAG: hypothetical protein JWN94_2282 [Betaproteobacteria bacterium]|nr:hypothetical protein [Betaproteobacteria bacterium]
MRVASALGLACLLLFAVAASAQQLKLAPVDEGASDPNWPRFKARLVEALAKRDQQFVLGIVDRRIRNMSGTDGEAEFKKLWELQSADGPLWTELAKLLFLGSVYVKRDAKTQELCAPYVYYRWPRDNAGNASGAVIARETLLKAQPAANAVTLASLSYDLVAVADWEVADQNKESTQKWVKLKSGATEGYVPEEHVRSPLEYRACFASSGTRWRMTALEVGE